MTDYGVIYHTFWTGKTGKDIKKVGALEHVRDCQVIAAYLMTNKHRNALGLYYMPIVLLSHETGIPFEGASKGLESLFEVGFCTYDVETEFVWVFEMANFQIGELKERDNRVKWINKLYSEMPKNPFLKPFFDKYGRALKVLKPRDFEGASKGLRNGSEGASKPETDTVPETDIDLPFGRSASAEPFQPGPQNESRHFSAHVGEHFRSIKASCETIAKFPPLRGRRFNPFQWVQKHVNEKRHPGAIAETISALTDQRLFLGINVDPFAYANKILTTKNQNWNERDAVAIHEELKALDVPALRDITAGLFERF